MTQLFQSIAMKLRQISSGHGWKPSQLDCYSVLHTGSMLILNYTRHLNNARRDRAWTETETGLPSGLTTKVSMPQEHNRCSLATWPSARHCNVVAPPDSTPVKHHAIEATAHTNRAKADSADSLSMYHRGNDSQIPRGGTSPAEAAGVGDQPAPGVGRRLAHGTSPELIHLRAGPAGRRIGGSAQTLVTGTFNPRGDAAASSVFVVIG